MFSLLQKIPCITDISTETLALWEICLADVWLPNDLAEWKYELDELSTDYLSQTLFVNFPESQRKELTQIFGFSTIELPDLPPIELVNRKLPDLFNPLKNTQSNLLKQSEIAKEITSRIAYELPDIVVFLILDGLSFYDVNRWTFPPSWRVKCEPCLVDGLSVTTNGMRRLIGSPCLTHRLFEVGYKQRLGFSYWERSQNKLTNNLFAEFPKTQLFRVTTFEDALHKLQTTVITDRILIQIVKTGLDGYCHSHREKPNIPTIIDQIKQNIEQIVEVLSGYGKIVKIFVTSDHGILWYDTQEKIDMSEVSRKPRYSDGESVSKASTLCVEENGEKYTVLIGDRAIVRNRKVTEWGFHGGISAQESLVPFLEINPTF